MKIRTLIILMILCANALTAFAQMDSTRSQRRRERIRREKMERQLYRDTVSARYPVSNVIPESEKDLVKLPMDLRHPDNFKQDTTYNDKDSTFLITTKMGNTKFGVPFILSQEDYAKSKMRNSLYLFFKKRTGRSLKNSTMATNSTSATCSSTSAPPKNSSAPAVCA